MGKDEKINREKEANELLTSFVADIDLVTDWFFFVEVIEKDGTEEEISRPIKLFQLLTCIAGSITWAIVASNGRLVQWLWTLGSKIAFFLIRPTMIILFFLFQLCFYLPLGLINGGLYVLLSLCCQNFVSRWFKKNYDAITDSKTIFEQNFEPWFIKLIKPFADRINEGIRISAGWVLVFGVICEDLPQILVTFIIEDMGDNFEVSRVALLNLLLAGFDILFKLADAWDSRSKFIDTSADIKTDQTDLIASISPRKKSTRKTSVVSNNDSDLDDKDAMPDNKSDADNRIALNDVHDSASKLPVDQTIDIVQTSNISSDFV